VEGRFRVGSVASFLDRNPSDAAGEQGALAVEQGGHGVHHQADADGVAVPNAAVPVLEAGAMIRKGQTGAAHEDGMTSEIAGQLRAFGSKIVTDPAALKWLYEGGVLPAGV